MCVHFAMKGVRGVVVVEVVVVVVVVGIHAGLLRT
jgi:hypothetical protein